MNARILLAFSALTLCGWAATSPDSLVLPERVFPALDSILQQATQQSPRMVARAIDLEIAENNRLQARAAVLPFVGGSLRFVEARDDRADLTTPSRVQKSYYDVTINQPLFFWGERMNTKRIGEIQKSISVGNYREAYRQFIQELRMKYLVLIVQKQQVRRATDGLALAQQQMKLGEERLAKRVISDVDFYPLRLAVEQGQIALERTEWEYEQNRRSFARLAGLPAFEDAQVPDDMPLLGYDAQLVDRLLGEYLSAKDLPTNEAVAARRQVEVAELTLKNEKTRLRPKISLTAGTNQDEQAYSLNTAQKYRVNSLFAGVSVSWTIFDGFAAQASTRNALARLRQSRLDADEVAHRLGQQAQHQVKLVNFTARTMAITDRGLAASETNVKTKMAEVQRGIATDTDVAVAKLQLLDARIAAFNNRYEYFWRIGDFLGTLAADPAVAALPVK
jgi:outer membrane protein TolC